MKRKATNGDLRAVFAPSIYILFNYLCFCFSFFVFFFSSHKKCHIGDVGSRIGKGKVDCSVLFPRDEDGLVDPIDGKISDERREVLNCKYEKEIRLALGVLMTRNQAQEKIGKRLNLFSYTEKTLITIKDRDKARTAQIRHVHTMPKNGYWVESRREKGVLYRNDPIREIFGLGERSADVLQNKYKISTVNDLKELSEEKLNTIVREKALARFTPVRVAGWVAIAKGCRDANAPEPIDHRKHTNPYVSKFGDNDWEHALL